MTNYKSTVTVNRSAADVFAFLGDMANHRQLMPPEVTNWQADRDSASFSVNGMFDLAVKITTRQPDTLLIAEPAGKAPVELKLQWVLTPRGSDATEATFTISADLNFMLKAVAGGKLKQLAEYNTTALHEVFG